MLDHANTVDEFSAKDQIMRAGGRVPRLKIFQLGIVEKNSHFTSPKPLSYNFTFL